MKTGIRPNKHAIWPDQARELGRQNWWACPPPLALLSMTSKLQERPQKVSKQVIHGRENNGKLRGRVREAHQNCRP